jgi:hypothetical protein
LKAGNGIDLPEEDFRRLRRYLAPWLFLGGKEGTTYPPPSDLMPEERWDGVMTLPTDVALKTTSYEGSLAARLEELQSDWIFSWPQPGEAPFADEVCLLAGEEFDALVFNAVHGYYRQALGCLRNALEVMTIAAALAVTDNRAVFEQWRGGDRMLMVKDVRPWLRDSPVGRELDAQAAPLTVFADARDGWLKARYERLCHYTHGRAGYNNVDFWESNGPVFRPQALLVVEQEFRETLAQCYLMLRLAWAGYTVGIGQPKLLDGSKTGWERYEGLLRRWLLGS